MLLTFHTLAGAAIASQIPNPLISWPLAFISHFVLDLIPHWDFFTSGSGLTKKIRYAIFGDIALGLLLGLTFAVMPKNNFINISGACFMACLPDGLEAPWLFWDWHFWLGDKMLKFQRRCHFKTPLPWGLVTSLGVAAGALYFLLR